MTFEWSQAPGYAVAFLAQSASLALGPQVVRSSFCTGSQRKVIAVVVITLNAALIGMTFHSPALSTA